MRDIEERFLDMLEAIQRIGKYAARGRQAFVSDELIQTYIVHNLQILGEAAAKVSTAQQAEYPDLPWPKMIGMRNVLVHNYFNPKNSGRFPTQIKKVAITRHSVHYPGNSPGSAFLFLISNTYCFAWAAAPNRRSKNGTSPPAFKTAATVSDNAAA
jgi:uncharacterized protein with HEPN domain